MPYFKDEQEVYDHLGKLIADVANDEELGPRLRRANTILRYEHSDPSSAITVRLREEGPCDVDFGESEMEPEVTVAMSADVAHRFWLAEVNLAAALVSGQVEARGPVNKMLELVPLAGPVSPRYRQQLAGQGREDLLET